MLRALLRLLCRLAYRVEWRGHPVPERPGKLLIIANHQSFLDGLLLGLFLPFRATFVVHSTVLKNRLFRYTLSFVPHLAVDPHNPIAMKTVIRLLEAGEPVVIFPEGRITVTGGLMKIHDGPAFVAERADTEILPICLDGPALTPFSRLPGHHPRRWLPKITLTVLPPRRLPPASGEKARERRHRAAEAMRRTMQEMLFASRPVQTLPEALLDAAARHGRASRIAMDIRQEEESYGQLLTKMLALGRLCAKISQPGETLGILLPNVLTTLGVIFGLGSQGRIPAMLNYTAGQAALQDACSAASIRTVITSRQFLDAAGLHDTVAGLAGIEVVCLEDLRSRFSLADKLWLFGFARWWPRRAIRPGAPEEAAVVLFTSGSEGRPKGVVHSHQGILANVAQIRAIIDFSPADKFLMALPLFHAFGFTAGGLLPLLSGARLLLHPSPLHYRIIPELAYEQDCTVLLGTGTFLGHYARHAHPYDFRSVRYVVAGAERLSEEVRRTWLDKFGLRIYEGYGATECAPVLAVNTPQAFRAGSVGTFLPGLEWRLEAVPGIAPGGQLLVRGPNVMLGYLRPEAPGVLEQPVDGWYATGDIVAIDADGYAWIEGRLKRFAKIAGEMVSLETVEAIAHAADTQAAHAALSVPDAQRGECVVLCTTAPALDREALLAAARRLGASELALPRRIVRLAEIPRLGSGKTDYRRLRELLPD